MASGFIVLPDGRCFSRRSWADDAVIRAIAEQLSAVASEQQLGRWLLEQLPGEDVAEDFSWGWVRASDGETVIRFIDLRLMTSENQRLFCESVGLVAGVDHSDESLTRCLADLSEMIVRFERGEPPLSKSDWREVVPAKGNRIGPGWPVE
jgi:hypothetical protein